MKLYHGTNFISAEDICNNGINFDKSMNYLDFGKGFYLTNDYFNAVRRANKKTFDYNKRYHKDDSAAIVVVNFEYKNNLKCKKFSRFIHDDEWAKFVVANRLPIEFLEENHILEHNLDNKYDIVEGGIADSDIFVFKDYVLNKEFDFNNIKAEYVLDYYSKDLGYQLSIHTVKGLSCIKDMFYDII